MTQRIGQLLWLLLAASFLSLTQSKVTAQEDKSVQRESSLKPPEVIRDPSGRVSVKLERGGKVWVGNRSTGPIVVVGWDSDLIEATAISDRGIELVRVKIAPNPTGTGIALKADYAEGEAWRPDAEGFGKVIKAQIDDRLQEVRARRQDFELRSGERKKDAISPSLPAAPVQPASPPPLGYTGAKSSGFDLRPGEIFLEVKVPRYAEIELIEVVKSDVLVAGVETAITVSGDKSTIKLRNVGAAEVKTRSGDVEVENARELIDVITTSGNIRVKNAGGDVRALSINGRIEIQCARGRVDVGNTDGSITLAGIGGDASATTTNSRVSFSGAIRADGRYYFKSMSGAVEMLVPTGSPGFTATLSSYRGNIDTDIPLKIKKPSPNNPVNRRLIGSYGNGQAQITLDSFDGAVRLGKMTTDAAKECK